ncbi:helix-turn-helix domain-containing protein [Streptomyces sp. NPDC020883]|uniref:MmyB family transcriptional regulator n=1 Tax=Streptomyces sp. NPDC020883 TaxID=3365099 RepID=UPI003797606E
MLVRHRELTKPQASPYHQRLNAGLKPQRLKPGPKPTGTSAERFSKSLGMSKPIYLKIEKGEREPTVDEVEQIAALLHMTWRARAALFRRALHCEPTVAAESAAGSPLPTIQRALLAGAPSCVTDLAYNIASHNDLFATLLPHAATSGPAAARPNLMRAALLQPYADRWSANSPEWQEELTAELIESVALHQDHPELQQLHTEVSEDPVAGPVYANAPRYVFPDRDCKLLLSRTFPELGVRHLFFLCE